MTEVYNQLSSEIDNLIIKSRNIWNEETATKNIRIDASGSIINDTKWKTSDFIEIKEGVNTWVTRDCTKVGEYNVALLAEYDKDKNFTGRIQNYTEGIDAFGIPSATNTKYIRICAGIDCTDIMVVVDYQDNKPTYTEFPYMPYGGGFNTNLIDKFVEDKSKEIAKIVFDENIHDDTEDIDESNPLAKIISDGGMCGIIQKMGIIGDSLSSGCMEIHKSDGSVGGVDMYEYSWGQRIARITGNTVFNFSCGGLKAKSFHTTTNAKVKQIDDADKKCQAYIIALGVNDIADTSINVGTSADISNDSSESFYGYYARIIKKIKTIQPQAKIFLVGLPKHDDMTKWGKRFTDFKNAIADMANHFDNCYYMDFFTYELPYDSNFKEMYFNGFHENAMGYQRTAWVMSTYIDWIIRKNYRDFREIAYIGTGYHYYE